MSGLFRPESGFMMRLSQGLEMLYVGLLWLLFSLPLITIGAASAAAYYTMTKTVRGFRGYVLQEFVRSFRDNFRQGTVLWALCGGSAAVILTDLYLLRRLSEGGGSPSAMILIVSCLLLFALAADMVLFVYAAAYTARFRQKTGVIIRNSLLMSLRHLPSSLLILAVLAAAMAALSLTGLLIALLPGICCMLFSQILERIFYRYMSEEDRRMEDRRRGG